MRRERIPDLISEIGDELSLLESLVLDVAETYKGMPASPKKKRIYEESLALKLHNFYTGCERMFQKIADDINGGTSRSLDWHRRLLKSISLEIENIRPPVISKETERALEEYLAFRHVVRNIYGFEIESERLKRLIERLSKIFKTLREDIEGFLNFLRSLSM